MGKGHTITRPGTTSPSRIEESPNALKRFLELFNSATAIGTVVVTLTGGLFFARDYFATKTELKVLQCRMDAGQVVAETYRRLDANYAQTADLKLMQGSGGTDAVHEAEILRLEKDSALRQAQLVKSVDRLSGAACQQEAEGRP